MLILTARGRPEDVLAGFAAGADDYLPKPFELPIFLARLQGLLRRSAWHNAAPGSDNQNVSNEAGGSPDIVPSAANETFAFAGKAIDFETLELRTPTNAFQLTLMEAKLLRHLIRSGGKTVSRKSILEDVGSPRGHRYARD